MDKIMPLKAGRGNTGKIGTIGAIASSIPMRWKMPAAVLLSAIAITGMLMHYSDGINKDLAQDLVRLHVVANSDTVSDQQLKKYVRDAVLAYLENGLKSSSSARETKSFINGSLAGIERTAAGVVREHGYGYAVHATLGNYPFPTKKYGDIELPAGYYQALRIEIGKADGANWWCVLFPPLCFVDATHGKVPESLKKELRSVLTDEEYGIVAASTRNTQIPVKIRFKIVEFFEDSRVKFAGMIGGIFK